jgi:hypothetical protein
MIYIIAFILLLIIYYYKYKVEKFAIPYIDPYSLYLHADITKKEETWRRQHRRKLYYYDDIIPQRFKDF